MTAHLLAAARSLTALLVVTLAAAVLPAQEDPKPWRLDTAIDKPSWLKLSGRQRMRIESINGQVRPNQPATDDQWFARTSLRADLDFGQIGGTIEVMDSRVFGGKDTSFASTAFTNVTDFIQAHATLDLGKHKGADQRLLVGRYTQSLGSRRFMIRNGYRNTVNTFDGIDLKRTEEDGSFSHLFWNLPVRRRPFDAPSLRDNEFEWDDQDKGLSFYGLFKSTRLDEDTNVEVYVFGKRQNAANLANVDIWTPGARLHRKERRGAFSGQVEFAYQFGHSQLSSTGPRLNHDAFFGHASLGYTFDCDCRPTLQVAWDYATGDRNPNDGDNNRFDRLFGAPRFEYSPTGLYGFVQRSNFNTPELRLTFKPTANSKIMVAYRNLRLAEARDQWIANGIQDNTGNSGSDLGDQFELRARYDFIPGNMFVEAGGAYLVAGDYLDNARAGNLPSRSGRDARYGYVEMIWIF